MDEYASYVKFTTTAENRDALIGILSEAAKSMEKMNDCKIYIVNKDNENPEITWVTEVWATDKSHADSLLDEQSKKLITQAMSLLIAKPEQVKLSPISGKGI